MNCVLLVTAPDGLGPAVIAGAVAGVDAGLGVDSFDRYYECSARESTVATSMLTGVYEQVHGVGAVLPGGAYPGPTLPGVLRERGFDCATFGSTLSRRLFGADAPVHSGHGFDREAPPVVALAGWLSLRADGQRPFFALLWDRGPGERTAALAELLEMLARRNLIHDTVVVAVGTYARAKSELSAVFPAPPPLVVLRPERSGVRNHAEFVLDTVDLYPTIRALLVGDVAGLSAEPCCGVSCVTTGGSVIDRGRVSVFADLVDDRLGIRAGAVVGARSRFVLFVLDPPGRGRRLTRSRLAGLVRGPHWRRKLLVELVVRGRAQRVAGIAGAATTARMTIWGRREVEYWQLTNEALTEEVRRSQGADDDAALRARLRGLGYLG